MQLSIHACRVQSANPVSPPNVLLISSDHKKTREEPEPEFCFSHTFATLSASSAFWSVSREAAHIIIGSPLVDHQPCLSALLVLDCFQDRLAAAQPEPHVGNRFSVRGLAFCRPAARLSSQSFCINRKMKSKPPRTLHASL